jgi:hypothetical protein
MAYDIQEIGRPISLTIGTPSVSLEDITDWSYSDEKSIEFKSSGNTTYDRHYLAKFGHVLMVKTSDVATALETLKKGATVENVTFLAEAPYVGDSGGTVNTIGLQHTDKLRIYFSYAVVEESGNISGNADGTPAEFEIKLRAIRKPDGTAPTTTIDLTSA